MDCQTCSKRLAKKRILFGFGIAALLALGAGGHASAQSRDSGLTIEGENNQPQLSEVPLPAFQFDLNEDLPAFDPSSEMLDLLLQPEILADLPIGGLDEEPYR